MAASYFRSQQGLCLEENDQNYWVWRGDTKKWVRYPKECDHQLVMKPGEYYDLTLESTPTRISPLYATCVRQAGDTAAARIVIHAPVFVANRVPGTRLFLGFNDFLGRVLIDIIASVPLRLHMLYDCVLISAWNETYATYWKVKQVVSLVPRVPKLDLIKATLCKKESDNVYICEQVINGELCQFRVAKWDFREMYEHDGGQDNDTDASASGDMRHRPTVTLLSFRSMETNDAKRNICMLSLNPNIEEMVEGAARVIGPTSEENQHVNERLQHLTAATANRANRERIKSRDPALLQNILVMLMGDAEDPNANFLLG